MTKTNLPLMGRRKARQAAAAGLVAIAGLTILSSGIYAEAKRIQEQNEILAVKEAAPTAPPSATPVVRALTMTIRATWYGGHYQGRRTAAWAHKAKAVPVEYYTFDRNAMTCAHKSLPFGTMLKLTWLEREVIVMVTDRMPGPGIDLSEAAFRMLAPTEIGVIHPTVEIL